MVITKCETLPPVYVVCKTPFKRTSQQGPNGIRLIGVQLYYCKKVKNVFLSSPDLSNSSAHPTILFFQTSWFPLVPLNIFPICMFNEKTHDTLIKRDSE